jgi:alanine-glyoxylate transaminase/serine-glyoxylate transaminase/serine-pyruvate transaminase
MTQPQLLSPTMRLLMGPGPSDVHTRVYQALSTPLVGHLDPQFLTIMDELQSMLRTAFQTKNRVAISLSGTGSSGMEAALGNLVERGDKILVCINGVFGTRMADVAERVGGNVVRLERPWGEVFDAQEILSALDADPNIRHVSIVHAETSTGALQPLDEIGRICRERDKYLIVDAVTSLGGVDLRVDDWNIDACYSGTQKCLSCPPGLAPITFSARAVDKIRSRAEKGVSWYLDLNLIDSYWTEGKRVYHHTAPISMNYALYAALGLVLEEGLENRFQRHQLNSQALVAGLEGLGFEMLVRDVERRLPMLNSVRIPDGVPDADVRGRLLNDFNVEIGAGLGPFAGKIWRIGLMGESSRRENVLFFLGALETILRDLDVIPAMGKGLEAAMAVYR